MVLSRILYALVMVAGIAGCNQSLFDAFGNRPDGGPGGGDAPDTPDSCPAVGCIADAAGDYDGTPRGADNDWRYLEDRRNRTWLQMEPSGGIMVGLQPGNEIKHCVSRPMTPACEGLPDALLVSSSGVTADPAIEYTASSARVIQLALRAFVPGDGVEHRVRLYRNSREDVLFTAIAQPGAQAVDYTIEVDALKDDRFLIALEPTGASGGLAALHFFVIDTQKSFPSTCQLAASFTAAINNEIENLCDSPQQSLAAMFVAEPAPPMPVQPVLVAGPFNEQGNAVDLALGKFYRKPDPPLPKGTAHTIQLWMRHDGLDTSRNSAYAFSDLDVDRGGGISIRLVQTFALKLGVTGFIAQNMPVEDLVDYPTDGMWHFVRVSYKDNTLSYCLDGVPQGSFSVPATQLVTDYPPHIGKNVDWSPYGAYFDGAIDDVRVLTVALPCN